MDLLAVDTDLEIADQFSDRELNMAPAEGNSPAKESSCIPVRVPEFEELDDALLNEFWRERDDDFVDNSTLMDLPTNETSDANADDELLHDRQQHCMFQDMSDAC
ncbi:hypothetical protein NHX12_022562 [Muraenolepis orangiensis]|uniref:Uncharacterized protein n=1 Tax=Muraenolepis orangiensis TaxID=630683 RepID=A0A9Q0ENG7_9TELE|nr:hypothetical protein NHX12_022562 [Muraenolepis orangiensis]